MNMRHYLMTLMALAGALSFSVSCGRKAAPVVPPLKTPAAVTQMSAASRENRVYIAWSRPTKDVSGRPLQDLMEFEIYRRQLRGPEEESQLSLIGKVKAFMPENATVTGDSYQYVDDDEGKGLEYDKRYGYHIRAINYSMESSPPSREVAVTVYPSPIPPRDLKAITGDETVLLSWEASKFRVDGRLLPQPPLYNVYRGKSPGSYGPDPINQEAILGESYADIGLENEASYYYVVRSTDTDSPPWHESLDSNEAMAIPSDTTPPSRPRNLSFVYGPEGVRLAWDPNSEIDLAGYFVYRSPYSGVGFVRLNSVPIPQITYVDKTASLSSTHYYAVSAVDSSPRRNESGLSEEVKADIP